MKKTFLLYILVLILICATLPACSSRDSDKVSEAESLPEESSEPESSEESSQEESETDESEQESGTDEEGSSEESSDASASQPEAKQAATVTLPDTFDYSASDVVALYARDYSDYAYVPVDSSRWEEVIALLKQAGQNQAQKIYSRNDGGFLVLLADGSKYSYSLIATAVRIGEDSYPLSADEYSKFVSLANELLAANPSYIQWLTFMTPSRIASVSYESDSTDSMVTLSPDNILSAASILRSVKIQKGSGSAYPEQKSFTYQPGNTVIKLTFDSGIVYSILIETGMFYIESSDMDNGCMYRLETSHGSINNAFNSFI